MLIVSLQYILNKTRRNWDWCSLSPRSCIDFSVILSVAWDWDLTLLNNKISVLTTELTWNSIDKCFFNIYSHFLWIHLLLISWKSSLEGLLNFCCHILVHLVLFYLIYFLCKFYLWSSTLKMWNRSNRAINSRSSTQASKTLSSPALVSVKDTIVSHILVIVVHYKYFS